MALTVDQNEVMERPVRRRDHADEARSVYKNISPAPHALLRERELPGVAGLVPKTLDAAGAVGRVELKVVRILDGDHVAAGRGYGESRTEGALTLYKGDSGYTYQHE